MRRLVAGADHGGVELKDELVRRLRDAGYEVEDVGTHGPDSVHYPDYAIAAAERVASGGADGGVLACGTGIGMSIAANKVKRVFCAKVNTVEEGRLAAEHNHANMLAFGGRITDPDTAWSALKAWLDTDPAGGRHDLRVGKIAEYETAPGTPGVGEPR